MPPMRIKAPLEYRFPYPNEVSFLEGVCPEPLAPDKMFQLATLPYQDDHFLQLAYSVSYPSLRRYIDKGYLDLIEQLKPNSNNGSTQITNSSLRSLVITTNLRSPLYQVREMKWFSGVGFLGSYGMYTVQSTFGFRGELMQRVVSQIAQYSLESCNTYKRLLIGLIQPDNSWQLVMVNMGIHSHNMKEGNNTVKVTILLYDPTDFIGMVAGMLKPQDVPTQKLVTYVKVARSLEHFKPSKICSKTVTLDDDKLPCVINAQDTK